MRRDVQPVVYMLASQRNGTIYIGVTSNLMHRVVQHREQTHDGFTERYKIKQLVWFEGYATMEAASKRDKQLTKSERAWKIMSMAEGNPR